MDALQSQYLRAGLLIGLAVVIYVVMTALTWRSLLRDFGRVRDALRSLRARFRARRDPAFRRELALAEADAARLDAYQSLTGWLQESRGRRIVSGRLLERARTQAPDGLGTDVAARKHDEACEVHEGRRAVVAEYFATRTDEDLDSLGRGISASVYEGRVSAAEVSAFLKEERAAIERSPYLADSHFARLMRRFAPEDAPSGAGDDPLRDA